LATIKKLSNGLMDTQMISDFTLFNIAIINPITLETIDQGQMRAYHAREFLWEMEQKQIPTLVESAVGNDDHDLSFFMEYLCPDDD